MKWTSGKVLSTILCWLHIMDLLAECWGVACQEKDNLGIGKLYAKYFPGEDYNAHKAFGDI